YVQQRPQERHRPHEGCALVAFDKGMGLDDTERIGGGDPQGATASQDKNRIARNTVGRAE
ncbi:hypothetical protein KO516_19835, partial [Citreicella sp. C3M06]|uniref:hypothetical protein n=1 Tax=Citreicella sp. C3M06 TaxID=2841564 RepID=UPI001C0827D5